MSNGYLTTCIMFSNSLYIDTSMIDNEDDLTYAVYDDIIDMLKNNSDNSDDVYSYDGKVFNGNIPSVLLQSQDHTMKSEDVDIIIDIVNNTIVELDEDLSWGLTYQMLIDKTYNYIIDSIKDSENIFGYTFTKN